MDVLFPQETTLIKLIDSLHLSIFDLFALNPLGDLDGLPGSSDTERIGKDSQPSDNPVL